MVVTHDTYKHIYTCLGLCFLFTPYIITNRCNKGICRCAHMLVHAHTSATLCRSNCYPDVNTVKIEEGHFDDRLELFAVDWDWTTSNL